MHFCGDVPTVCHCNQSIDVLHYILNQCPDAVKLKNRLGELPLHKACQNVNSMSFIQLLIDMYPEALQVKDTELNYPLHLICLQQKYTRNYKKFKKLLEPLIPIMIEKYPQAVYEKNINSQYPLHVAFQKPNALSEQIMWQLFYRYPEAALQEDDDGLVPAVHIKRKRSNVYNWLSRNFIN